MTQLEGGEQMEQYPTSDKSKLLFAAPGGALLGAVTGGGIALFVLSAALAAPEIVNSPSGGFGAGFALLLGIAIAAIVGAAAGGCLIGWMSTRRRGRNVALILAALGYITGAVVGWRLLAFELRGQADAHQVAHRLIVDEQRQDQTNAMTSAAYSRQAAVDFPSLLGPLYYPGAKVTPWAEQPVDRTYPLIYLVTRDSVGKVIAYYQRVAPGGVYDPEPDIHFHTTAYRPGDRRHVYVGIEKDYGYVQIGIALIHDDAVVPPVATAPTAPSTPLPSPAETAELQAAYGNLVYPNATLRPSTLPSKYSDIPCAMEMMQAADGFDQVVAYYRSRLNTRADMATEYTGTTNRTSDGRLTVIHVKVDHGIVFIELSAL